MTGGFWSLSRVGVDMSSRRRSFVSGYEEHAGELLVLLEGICSLEAVFRWVVPMCFLRP